jgi:quercetin dioxygenase-like cupin family protein
MRLLLLALITGLLAGQAFAQDQNYPGFALLAAQTTIVGETIVYPTTGPARVTAAIVTLAPGERTIVHKHGAPMFGYVLEGELTVDYGAYGTRRYTKGQALMEAMAVAHSGQNTGVLPVQILTVYMGAEGTSNVAPANEPPRQ